MRTQTELFEALLQAHKVMEESDSEELETSEQAHNLAYFTGVIVAIRYAMGDVEADYMLEQLFNRGELHGNRR